MQVACILRLLQVYMYMYSRDLINDLNENLKEFKKTRKIQGGTCMYMYVWTEPSQLGKGPIRLFSFHPTILCVYILNIFIHFTARVLLHMFLTF